MARSARSGASSISADDLIVLNEELAALVRAGVPLDVGLGRLSRGGSQRLDRVAAQLAEALRRGASLPEALEAVSGEVPATYRAIIEAGLRSGRLPEALEKLTEQAQAAAELRRVVSLSLIYPLMVVVVAWFLFVMVMDRVIGSFAATYDSFRLADPWWMAALRHTADLVAAWGWLVPVGIVVLAVWWIASRCWPMRGPRLEIGWIPGVGRVLRNERLAHFNGLLAVLIDSGVPLPDALRLAAQSVGDRRLLAGAARLAADVGRGEPLGRAMHDLTLLPPFMRWMIGTGEQQSTLVPALNQLAEMYRRRARYQADWFQLIFPVSITVGLGGSIVLFYVLALFVPLTDLLWGIALD